MGQRPDPLKRLYGVVFDHLWRRSGVTPADLAEGAHCSVGYLYLIRDGARLPNPTISKGLDETLDTGGLLATLGEVIEEELRRGKRGRVEAGDPEGIVQRRNLLQQAIVALAAAGATGPAAALEVIRSGLLSSVTNSEAVDLSVEDWEQTVWGYGRSVLTEPPEVLIIDLAADVADIQLQLERANDENHEHDLSRLGAALAAMMATCLIDLGQLRPARRWWSTARSAADASTDPSIQAWVRGREAIHALYDHRPLQVVIDLAHEAQAVGGIHVGTAEATAAEARALALMGRDIEALHAVRHVGDLFAQLPPQVADQRDSAFGWAEHRWRHTESFVYSILGALSEADRAQEQALRIYPDAPRARVYIELHRAMCQVRGGNLDDGVRHAQGAIEALPERLRTGMVRDDGQRLLDAVPTKERKRASVAELRELLAH